MLIANPPKCGCNTCQVDESRENMVLCHINKTTRDNAKGEASVRLRRTGVILRGRGRGAGRVVLCLAAAVGASAALAAPAPGSTASTASSQAPRWIDILPLPDPIPESYVADAAFLGDETISDGIAWSCKLVPEGDPAVDKASVYAERFRRVAPRVRARSKICQGFLIQATIGHGWTPGRATPWQKIVQSTGRTTYRFCPLGAEFRRYVDGQLRTLAAAGPEFFLVDDDTKLLGPKIDGCFCPLHLAGFAAKTGRRWSREELVAGIEGGDAALAAAWRSYAESTLVDYARLIRAAFPDTVPGVLCVTMGPKDRLGYAIPCAKALAGPGFRPLVRLGSAPYWSDGLFDILTIRRYVAYQLSYLHPEADVLVEADTCPQVRWQTSATRALDHVMMLTAEGCRGAKMWWHRTGNVHETRSSSAYLRALRERSGALRWLAESGFAASGVWCPEDEKIVEWGESVFGLIGIAYHYGQRANGDVAALTADSSAALDGAALTNVLSGPVVLDGSAAIALTRRGFGDLIGVRAKPWAGPAISYEDFGGVKQAGSMGGGPADLSDRQPGAEELTRLFNRVSSLTEDSAYLAPGSLWHENSLGGRVVTLAAAVPKPPFPLTEFGYCNETRKAWLVKTLTRLANGRLPGGVAYLGDESVLCEAGRTRRGERVVIVDSLDLDVIENPEFAFDDSPSAVERLTDDGRWEAVSARTSAARTTILATVLAPHRPAVFRFVPPRH